MNITFLPLGNDAMQVIIDGYHGQMTERYSNFVAAKLDEVFAEQFIHIAVRSLKAGGKTSNDAKVLIKRMLDNVE